MSDLTGYREYVSGRLDQLRRTAYLLCGDWHPAQHLTQITFATLYRSWQRIDRHNTLDRPPAATGSPAADRRAARRPRGQPGPAALSAIRSGYVRGWLPG